MSAQDSRTPPAPPADLWSSVDDLWAWLDAHRSHGGHETLLLRVLKLSEEVGEVSEAVIGALGQNPRKGTTHTWDDVQAELCDVVITALVALRTLTPRAREVFTHHLAAVSERSLTPGHENSGSGSSDGDSDSDGDGDGDGDGD
jgi:NTP pyrophosphatase (non-canonical NTP hydrolase)